jgi:hypothetical protein
LKSQIVISTWGGARRATPYAFTEQGVATLSSVLRSKRAALVNIEIMLLLAIPGIDEEIKYQGESNEAYDFGLLFSHRAGSL